MKKDLLKDVRVIGLCEDLSTILVRKQDYPDLGKKLGIMAIRVLPETRKIYKIEDLEIICKFVTFIPFKKNDEESKAKERTIKLFIKQHISDDDIQNKILAPLDL
jgi:hypothetical protein